jgi:hypothetical protein
MDYRNGETTNTHFRAKRFFCISGLWYFATRENLQVGPFAQQDDAELELIFFLRHLNEGGIYAKASMLTPWPLPPLFG